MCDYITPASSPPTEGALLSRSLGWVSDWQAGLFPLSVGCYWWGEVMDLPTVLAGTLRINQTVGKTQPAIPPLSRLNCHFISFIYGGSALFWTPPLSSLPLKMLLFFFPPLQSAMATHIHPYPSFLPSFFSWKTFLLPHILPGTSPCFSVPYVEVKMWAACYHGIDKRLHR